MSEERTDVDEQKKAAPDSSPENKPADNQPAEDPEKDKSTDPSDKGADDDKGDGSEKKEHQVPISRLNEVLDENKELKKDMQGLNDRFTRMGKAMTGEGEEDKRDEELSALSKKYNVSGEFLTELSGVFQKRAEGTVEQGLKTVKQSQAQSDFDREIGALQSNPDLPDAADMSEDDSKKLKEMAHSAQYSRTPLADIYRIMTFSRSRGSSKTAEGGAGGGGQRKSNENPLEAMANMDLEEFEKFSNGLAKKG